MFSDKIRIEIISADIPRLLRDLAERNITLFDISYVGDIAIACTVRRKDYSILEKRLAQKGDRLRIIKAVGIHKAFTGFLHRPVLMVSLLLLLLMSSYLPTRVLFVEVEGNSTVPTQMLLQRAEECGIRLGASRRRVRSEQVKNQLLAAVPELQWAGINTTGCVATISVEEKSEQGTPAQKKSEVANIVAARDGRITQCVIQRGNPLCVVGQAVTSGQLLVSGYIDRGLKVQAVKAEAEIMAQTLRPLEVFSPTTYMTRAVKTGSTVKISLQIGKKLINFYNGSGISDGSCVKMYSKKYMTLPGGKELPIALVITSIDQYSLAVDQVEAEDITSLLHSTAQAYLHSQMVAGEILRSDSVLLCDEDRCTLRSEYICSEMIGQVKYEESLHTDGKDN